MKFLIGAIVLLFVACGNSQKDAANNNGTLSSNGLAESDGTTGNYYSRDP